MSECLSWFVTRRPFKKKKRSSIALIARSTLRESERKSQTCAHVPRRHLTRKKTLLLSSCAHQAYAGRRVSTEKSVVNKSTSAIGTLRPKFRRRRGISGMLKVAEQTNLIVINWVRVRGKTILIGTEIASQLKLQRCQTVRRR